MFKNMSEDVKYKSKIIFDSFYFILPDNAPAADATETDLVLVKAIGFADQESSDYCPNGVRILGRKSIFNEQGELSPIDISGTAIYQSINGTNAVLTSSGVNLRHSFTSDAGYVEYEFLPMDSLSDKFSLKYIFSVSKQVKIAINSCGDVLFDNPEEAEQYTRFLTFYGGELNSGDLVVIVNEKCIHYTHYDVFYNNEKREISHSDLFDYLCSISKDTRPPYQRTFPLRPEWFEIVPAADTVTFARS